MQLALLLLATAGAEPPSPPPQVTEHAPAEAIENRFDWRTDYLVDYGLVVLGLGAFIIADALGPVDKAVLGERYDPEHPEVILLEDVGNTDLLERLHRPNLVSGTAVGIWGGIGAAVIAAIEAIPGLNGGEFDPQLLHDSLVGYAEALALTLGVTEVLKASIGRLRPDFQDRLRRYHCHHEPHPLVDCTTVSRPPLAGSNADAKQALEDSRVSFPSGHSSMSFAIATYWSLVIGGRFVWGTRAQDAWVPVALLAQGALIASASFVALSRLDDGRHHLSDIVIGSLIGITLANVSYWRHYNSDGLPRFRTSATTWTVVPHGAGAALRAEF